MQTNTSWRGPWADTSRRMHDSRPTPRPTGTEPMGRRGLKAWAFGASAAPGGSPGGASAFPLRSPVRQFTDSRGSPSVTAARDSAWGAKRSWGPPRGRFRLSRDRPAPPPSCYTSSCGDSLCCVRPLGAGGWPLPLWRAGTSGDTSPNPGSTLVRFARPIGRDSVQGVELLAHHPYYRTPRLLLLR